MKRLLLLALLLTGCTSTGAAATAPVQYAAGWWCYQAGLPGPHQTFLNSKTPEGPCPVKTVEMYYPDWTPAP